jgi:hypothetical protein
MYAFAFRFAVVLALALIVLLVTTWARPRIPSNACRKQPHFVLSPRPMCIPTHWMSYWERRGPRGLCSFSLWGPISSVLLLPKHHSQAPPILLG